MEGTDLTGKSTLASNLSRELDLPVVRPWIDLNYPKPAVISVARSLKQLFAAANLHLIYDRFFFSELPYALVLGREHGYLHRLISEWDDVPGLCMLHLTAADDVLEQRYRRADERYVTLAQVQGN